MGLQCVCGAVNLIKMTLKTKSSKTFTIIERSDPSLMRSWQHLTTFGSYNIKANMILECRDLHFFHCKIKMTKWTWLEEHTRLNLSYVKLKARVSSVMLWLTYQQHAHAPKTNSVSSPGWREGGLEVGGMRDERRCVKKSRGGIAVFPR